MKCICSEAGCRVDLHRQIKVELKKYAMLGNFVSSPVHALNAGGMKPVGAATCRGSQGLLSLGHLRLRQTSPRHHWCT